MSQTINYEIGVETGASVVNPGLFQQQILDSTMTQAAKDDLDGVGTSGGSMNVTFLNPLSTGAGSDREKLDALALAHMGETTSENRQTVFGAGESTPNATNNWVNSLSLQSEPLNAGKYLILVKADLRLDTGSPFTGGGVPANYPIRVCEARLRVDGVLKNCWQIPWNTWHTQMGLDLGDHVIGATPLIELDFRLAGTGTDSAKIRDRVIDFSSVGGQEGEGED